jgi:hypothetical protein
MRLERYAEAEVYLARAAALRPESAIAWDNLGCCRRDRNHLADSLQCFDQALALDPASARAHYDRALALLALGRYGEGFIEYEYRWQAAQLKRPGDSDAALRERLWCGGEIAGQRILLYAEQGLGDAIQFLRYVRLVQARGAEVVLEVQPALRPLARCLQPACELGPGDASCAFDVHCPLLTLPLVFDTSLASVPAPAVFAVPADVHSRWRERLPAGDRLRVGLAWAGNPANPIDYRRSTHLRTFEPLLADPRLRCFSLQVGPRSEEAAAAVERGLLTDLAPALTGLTETAAALLEMDVVVTVESLIAHLAASLGREVWIPLPFAADWRWLVGRDDSPWYPGARLFRQTVPGDWSGPVERIGRALDARVAQLQNVR